jgi:hypothetical protein
MHLPVDMGAGSSVISSQGFTTLASRIQGSIDELNEFQSDAKASYISSRYVTLLSEVNKTITDLNDMPSDIVAAQQNTYNTRVYDLDLEKDRTLLRIKGVTADYIIREISYFLGMIFAIIIITNTMINEDWKYKLYYALWGAIFYPIVLLYGVYNPPQWYALLIPFFEISSTSPWYIRYMYLFSYNPPGKAVIGLIDKKLTLRIFTVLVIIICIISQTIVTLPT